MFLNVMFKKKKNLCFYTSLEQSFPCLSWRTLHMVVTSCGGYFRWVVLLCWVTGLVIDFSIIWFFSGFAGLSVTDLLRRKPFADIPETAFHWDAVEVLRAWDLWDKQALLCRWHCQGCRYYCKWMLSGLREDSRHASGCASEADVTICLHS